MTPLTTALDDPRLRFRIDCFSVPAASRGEFEEATRRNLDFISTLPGFRGHLVFRKTGGPTAFDVVTLAVWESQEAIDRAATAVRAHYERIGFDRAASLERWQVRSELGGYELLRGP
ncbi:antibiotic biosynthesis monooxygenase family protein [Anaeromyxobacter terrae]|uniref:antibiotic biosynthesis monooxygenase family protein n=1 Tax=Anaeromyxobacter terrae TaxID=2925406 RepID=UPI001F596802|nr:antibiotic biosynthesis monooxygenase family protein [Anaeromyxobacter sp. SG22]